MAEAPTRPAAFLDRDGVLNEDRGYVYRAEDLVWVADAAAALRRLREAGHLIFVVTNQSGVGRGFYREDDVHRLHAHMQIVLGGCVDAFRFCPHHPEAALSAYRQRCACRKPAPGMIKDLLGAYPVDAARSFLIGDRETDLEAARAAGLRGYRFEGGSLDAFVSTLLAGTTTRSPDR